MRIVITIFSFFLGFLLFGQNYSEFDKPFLRVGDRFSISANDSTEFSDMLYRATTFVEENPRVNFVLNNYFIADRIRKRQGQTAIDSLIWLEFRDLKNINFSSLAGDSLYAELEIKSIRGINQFYDNNYKPGIISIPEMNVLLRDSVYTIQYQSAGVFDSTWIMTSMPIRKTSSGKEEIIVTNNEGREASISMNALLWKDTSDLGTHKFRLSGYDSKFHQYERKGNHEFSQPEISLAEPYGHYFTPTFSAGNFIPIGVAKLSGKLIVDSVMLNAFIKANSNLKWSFRIVYAKGIKRSAIKKVKRRLNLMTVDSRHAISELRIRMAYQKRISIYILIDSVILENNYLAQNQFSSVLRTVETEKLYRNYHNVISFVVKDFPVTADSVWLEADSCKITNTSRGSCQLTPFGKNENVKITIKSWNGVQVAEHGSFNVPVYDLPEPSIYLGSLSFESVDRVNENSFIAMDRIFAKYPPEIPLKAEFEVKRIEVYIDSRLFIINGRKLSEEFMQAYDQAPLGAKVTFKSVVIDGPEKFEIELNNKSHIKSESAYKYSSRRDIHW